MSQSVSRSRSHLPVLARLALGNPWAPALLVIILTVDANTLPNYESVVGSLLHRDEEQWAFASARPTWAAYGYPSDAGLQIFPNRRDAAAAGFSPQEYDWAVEMGPTSRMRRGLWAPTVLTIQRDLDQVLGRVPQEAVAFFSAAYSPEIAADFKAALAGRHTERHIIWPGVGHNTFALAVAGLLAVSCWLNAPRLKPLLRSERRRRRGLCPRCAYDLLGLQRCPECGHPQPVSTA